MKHYTGKQLTHISFPLGGIGAGMLCLQGHGALGSVSVRNRPDLFYDPILFSAVHVKDGGIRTARVLEGQVPYQRIFGIPGEPYLGTANGSQDTTYGLPRFRSCDFSASFPFAQVEMRDDAVPLAVSLTAFSPFIPSDSGNSSLPAATLEYTFRNTSPRTLEAIYYFSAVNFMRFGGWKKGDCQSERVLPRENGFVLHQPPLPDAPHAQGDFAVSVPDEQAMVNTDWFDGGWFDILTMQWNDIKAGNVRAAAHPEQKSPGGSVAVPFVLEPGQEKRIVLHMSWYVPKTDQRYGYEEDPDAPDKETYAPWYAGQFDGISAVMKYYEANYAKLRENSAKFASALSSSTLPPAAVDAISSNLTILKSPTVLRQTDGRFWAWEGTFDREGSCTGSCTHVWNYQQALCNLFPDLERSLRQTEFHESQDERGHQEFRSSLPIRKSGHRYHAASDGQLGGIMKMHREWRISGDTEWLAEYWPLMEKSMSYCISTWDKKREGVLKEPHHNTYDIEFWGADAMCSSFYLGALKAMTLMGRELGKDVSQYEELYQKGREYLETRLFNGEYFYQQTEWKTLEAELDLSKENPQSARLMEKEGPKYQYGTGCISDGMLGAWMAKVCGVGDILDPEKVKSHLLSVYRYNFKRNLAAHDNPQRPGYALGEEGGLLLCSWPRGGKPSLPFVYSDEVWTGIEYQVACHLISIGCEKEGLDIVETLRARYDGEKRNPYNEYECGYWYARAMASYGLLYAFTGVKYDAVTKTLYGKDGNYSVLLAHKDGFGAVTCQNGRLSYEPALGSLEILRTQLV